MLMLDTNVVSELRKAKAGNADTNVVAWAADASTATMFVSVDTIQELGDRGSAGRATRCPGRARCCGAGGKRRCCRRLPIGSFRSIPLSPAAAVDCTLPTRGP